MAAVTGHMAAGPILDGSGMLPVGFGAVRAEPRDLAAMHRGLTSTHFLRSVLSSYLQQVKLRHEWEGDVLVLRIVASPAEDADGPFIPRNVVGWSQMPEHMRVTKVWSYENSKMDCPSFDLPTGAGAVGGTCPGAHEGQSIVPGQTGKLPDGSAVDMPRTICNACYGEVGPIAYTNNVLRQMMRQVWVAGMLRVAPAQFVEVMAESILAMPESIFSPHERLPAPGGILPIRLHSVGDFFSEQYAEAWVDIVNRVAASGPRGKRFRFWAPTRVWAARGDLATMWSRLHKKLRQPNLLVRPSAFHFDDPSPPPLAPGLGKGSTSMHMQGKVTELQRTDFKAHGKEKLFFDWRCPTYSAREGQLKSCAQSPGPHKGHHCRTCWTLPNVSIDYPAH